MLLHTSYQEIGALLTVPVPDAVETAFEAAHDLHIRINGLMNGRNQMPLRPATDFLRSIINLADEKALLAFLGDAANATQLECGGSYTKNLWGSDCARHIVKQVDQEDPAYTCYAQTALLNPHNPLMPRIDAIIESRKSGVYIVMEKLLSRHEVPKDVINDYLWGYDHVGPVATQRKAELAKLSVSDTRIADCLTLPLIQKQPHNLASWAELVRQVVQVADARYDHDKVLDNIMFRLDESSGDYQPVITDPIVCGFYYDAAVIKRDVNYTDLSPRYRDRRIMGREDVMDIGFTPLRGSLHL